MFRSSNSGGRKNLPSLLSIIMAMVFACSIAVGGMSFSPVIKDETTGIALIVEAKETTTDYVATTGLNIRASASAIGKRLGSFAAGDIVKVYSITKGWAKISYNSATAYVSADYLAKPGSAADPNAKSSSTSGKSSSKSASKYAASASGAISSNNSASSGSSDNLKASKEQIIDDLNGVMSPLQRRMMKELLVHLDELNIHIKNLDDEIDNFMKPEEKKASAMIQDIPGIKNTSAQAIIAVIGTDMSRFPTDKHLASWAGMCPGDNESAHKRKSGKTRKGNKLLRTTLIICAHAAVKHKDSYFSAQFNRIAVHRGKKRAYVAVAHSMLIAIYHILKEGVVFKDLGADYYNQFNKERKINSYLKKLKALGVDVSAVAA